jgi:DNA-directed RNA polymerase specialized sigma24 family protein
LDAKAFLEQVEKLDKLIENKLREIQQLRSISLNITAKYGGERVQTSPNPHGKTNAIDARIDAEKALDRDIDELIDRKREVIRVIEQLSARHYDLLYKRYIDLEDLQDIADSFEKSYSWVTTELCRAREYVQIILDERKDT